MKDLMNLIIYIFSNYPKVDELSKPRLVKLIYLIDWKHTIVNGRQATPIQWYFNHYGPYVDTVIDLIKDHPEIFTVETRTNAYGGISDKIKLVSGQNVHLEESVKQSADFIISNTSQMSWTNFIDLVYSTYPIKTNSKYTYLNLVEEAKKFEKYKHNR
ncbi:DUF4065 domain-containing protein [Emticicia sp. ODNR4P]|nr:DUF4065 domain-containing protein [Emticicia sp. ODNR4P]